MRGHGSFLGGSANSVRRRVPSFRLATGGQRVSLLGCLRRCEGPLSVFEPLRSWTCPASILSCPSRLVCTEKPFPLFVRGVRLAPRVCDCGGQGLAVERFPSVQNRSGHRSSLELLAKP